MAENNRLKTNQVATRIRNPLHCRLCRSQRYGPRIHYLYTAKGVSLENLAHTYFRKLGYSHKQGQYALLRALKAHFDQEHQPTWIMDAERLPLKEERERLRIELGKVTVVLSAQLVDGKITDEDYLEKVKLISLANIASNPSQVTVRHGLEAIKMKQEQDRLGFQKSESLRNWFKLISGKPDKISSAPTCWHKRD